MRDISARELKGHNILAVERFRDSTPLDDRIFRPAFRLYGSPGDEMRLFLTEDGYQAALLSQQRRDNQNQAPCPRCRGTHHRLQAEEKAPPPVNPTACQERTELCVPLETLKKPSANTANPA